MRPYINRRQALVATISPIVTLISEGAWASAPTKGNVILAGMKSTIFGAYQIEHMLFPGEVWLFYLVVVPANVRQGTLIEIAKDFYMKYPKTRVRFFSDTKYIQQYADRDQYVNDKTGKVRVVDFPPSKWVQDHLLGNINNRSKANGREWMLEDRYGNQISLLP